MNSTKTTLRILLLAALLYGLPSHGNFIDKKGKDPLLQELKSIKETVQILMGYNRDSAYILAQEGIQLAIKAKDSSSEAYFYGINGTILSSSEDIESTLKYYYKAAEIYKNLGDSTSLANIYMSIGNRNLSQEQKYHYLKKALRISQSLRDTLILMKIYTNLGVYYQWKKDLDSAMNYYELALQMGKTIHMEYGIAVCLTNIGEIKIKQNEALLAMPYFHEARKYKITPRLDHYIQSQMTLAFLAMNQIDSALYYWNYIAGTFEKEDPAMAIDVHKSFAKYYNSSQNFQSANTHLSIKDTLENALQAKNQGNYLSLLELEYESRLKEEKLATLKGEVEKAAIMRLLFLIIASLTVIFSTILFCQQKQKAKKRRDLMIQIKQRMKEKKQRLEAEQKLLSTELENSELKRRRLRDELNSSNKELASFATNIVQNHTLLTEMQKEISEIYGQKDRDIAKDHLQKLNKRLLQLTNNNEQRNEFLKKSRELNHSLVFYLKTHFSQLNDADVNLLILLILKFTSKEIAALYNIEPESARKKRQRLRKKLKLSQDMGFDNFFDQVLADIKLKSVG